MPLKQHKGTNYQAHLKKSQADNPTILGPVKTYITETDTVAIEEHRIYRLDRV